ncbi:FG-GAP-like repeat-containing protein [Hymenobacter glacieicola]|uniref:PKD domain-containing protein n=1 Tax=Hymenobacter glacieicola TaxID=1562124 RepID=A0ABQ1X5R4_9BACT|nr:FG-GAP-like repeat-containing protein [Hymenobacter glacieicola]GGG60108.1 hypothetical protein GCM10011378_40090 [Hymenobacter glacieicola]
MKSLVTTALLSLYSFSQAQAQTFTDVTPSSIENLWVGANAWGDYDGDGDLDFVISGVNASGTMTTALYANTQGAFTPVPTAQFAGVGVGSVEWGDYDNDGDPDLLLCGATVNSANDKRPIARIYTNVGGGRFEELVSAQLPAMYHGEAKWGDYNNDGRLDVALAGNGKTGIFKNTGNGVFTEVPNLNLQFLFQTGRVSWSDYDQDGDLDLFVSGWTGNASAAKLYRNDGRDAFVDATPALIRGQHRGDAAWADADADGDPDLVVSGDYRVNGNDQYHSVLYLNNRGTFTASTQTAFWFVEDGSLAWGDADNDGLSDLLLLSGVVSSTRSIVYHNNGNGTFREVTEAQSRLRGFRDSDASWGDYDNDGDLDLLVLGLYNGVTKIYRNETVAVNRPPARPAATQAAAVSGTSVTLSWSAASDDHTPTPGLNYNLYVGKQANKQAHLSALANPLTGTRAIAAMGNAGSARSLTLQGLPGGRHYWGVQAIDASFLGSAFAPEQSFVIPLTAALTAAQSIACAGEPVRITYTGNAGPTAQLSWDFGGGTVVSGTGRGPYLVQWPTPGAKTVRLAVSDDGLAAPLATTQLLVNPRPTATLTGDSIICDGPARMAVALTGAAPWQLRYETGEGVKQLSVATSPFSFTTDSTGVSRVLSLTDASGCAALSTGDSIRVQRCVQALRPFPNPSSGSVYLGLSARPGPGGMVRVWNLQGQLVWEQALTGPALGQALELPLPSGLYHLQLETALQTTRTKLMINR